MLEVLLWLAHAAIDEHLVTNLPGYVNTDGTPKGLPTRHWSGYIPVQIAPGVSTSGVEGLPFRPFGRPRRADVYPFFVCIGTAFVHYWLVENAARDSTAPTVVWQQGGPGGSSLIGLFTELGPITLNDASFRVRTLLKPRIAAAIISSWGRAFLSRTALGRTG
jgi:hypothetical protein